MWLYGLNGYNIKLLRVNLVINTSAIRNNLINKYLARVLLSYKHNNV